MTYRILDVLTGKILAPPRDQPYTVDDLAEHCGKGRVIAAQELRRGRWCNYLWWW